MESNKSKLKKLTVLIADDDPNARKMAAKALSIFGYETLQASTGVEAVTKVTQNPNLYGLVLTDLQMENKDSGLDVIKNIRKYNKDIGIILISGSITEDIKNSAIELGANGILAKPYDITQLKNIVCQYVVKSARN